MYPSPILFHYHHVLMGSFIHLFHSKRSEICAYSSVHPSWSRSYIVHLFLPLSAWLGKIKNGLLHFFISSTSFQRLRTVLCCIAPNAVVCHINVIFSSAEVESYWNVSFPWAIYCNMKLTCVCLDRQYIMILLDQPKRNFYYSCNCSKISRVNTSK